MEHLLTAKQVAERLHLGVSSVYDLARAGLIDCLRLGAKGGRLLFTEEAVAAYLARAAAPPAPKEPDGEVRAALHHFRLPPPSPSRRRD